MRIFCKIAGQPAVIVGYGPGTRGMPKAIVLGLEKFPVAVELADCKIDMPRKIRRKLKAWAKEETQEALQLLVGDETSGVVAH